MPYQYQWLKWFSNVTFPGSGEMRERPIFAIRGPHAVLKKTNSLESTRLHHAEFAWSHSTSAMDKSKHTFQTTQLV